MQIFRRGLLRDLSPCRRVSFLQEVLLSDKLLIKKYIYWIVILQILYLESCTFSTRKIFYIFFSFHSNFFINFDFLTIYSHWSFKKSIVFCNFFLLNYFLFNQVLTFFILFLSFLSYLKNSMTIYYESNYLIFFIISI